MNDLNIDLKNRYNAIVRIFVIIGDLIICNLLFALFYSITENNSTELTKQILVTISIIYFTCVINNGIVLYKRRVHSYQIISRVLGVVCVYSSALAILFYIGDFYLPSVKFFIMYSLALFVCVSIFRLTVHHFVKYYRLQKNHIQNIVLVGSRDNNVELYHELADDRTWGNNVIGYFDDEPRDVYPEKCKWLGRPNKVIDYLKSHPNICELYCCLPSARKDEIFPIIYYCENNFVRFYSVPNVRNYLFRRMHLNMVGSVPCLSLYTEPLSLIENRFLKRSFDILFSLAFLVTLFPIILLIVTVVTKITMPGPIFFKQKRNGINGKEFTCYKFRSMKVNQDADKVQATKNDPRKTKWGNIMRKTNLDEFPQFINVLLGDMSIVGPRPHMVKHTEQYSKLIDQYMLRHLVKPGITGWSQVTGFRGETKELSQMEGRVKRDIWYIEHWSIKLDLYIIYKTVANMFEGEDNAY